MPYLAETLQSHATSHFDEIRTLVADPSKCCHDSVSTNDAKNNNSRDAHVAVARRQAAQFTHAMLVHNNRATTPKFVQQAVDRTGGNDKATLVSSPAKTRYCMTGTAHINLGSIQDRRGGGGN